jgi:hypothetical protein
MKREMRFLRPGEVLLEEELTPMISSNSCLVKVNDLTSI